MGCTPSRDSSKESGQLPRRRAPVWSVESSTLGSDESCDLTTSWRENSRQSADVSGLITSRTGGLDGEEPADGDLGIGDFWLTALPISSGRSNPNRKIGEWPATRGGLIYQQGICMPGESQKEVELTFRLDGRFTQMQSELALGDHASDQLAGVTCLVRADGQPLWQSPAITDKQQTYETGMLAVSGVQELTLVVLVDGPKDLGAGADVIWLSPRLCSEQPDSEQEWLTNDPSFTVDNCTRHSSTLCENSGPGSMVGLATNTVDQNNLSCWSAGEGHRNQSWLMWDLGHQVQRGAHQLSLCGQVSLSGFRYYTRGRWHPPKRCYIECYQDGTWKTCCTHRGSEAEGWEHLLFDGCLSCQTFPTPLLAGLHAPGTGSSMSCRRMADAHEYTSGEGDECNTLGRVSTNSMVSIELPKYSGTLSKKGEDVVGIWRHRLFVLRQGQIEYGEQAAGDQIVNPKFILLDGMTAEWLSNDDHQGESILLGSDDPDVAPGDRVYELRCDSQVETAILFSKIYATIAMMAGQSYVLPDHVASLLIVSEHNWITVDDTRKKRKREVRVLRSSPVVASSEDSFDASGVLDDLDTFHWKSQFAPHYIIFQFSDAIELSKIRYLAPDLATCPSRCELQFSDNPDGVWSTASQWAARKAYGWVLAAFEPRAARYWRLNILSTHGSGQAELIKVEFFGALWEPFDFVSGEVRNAPAPAAPKEVEWGNNDDERGPSLEFHIQRDDVQCPSSGADLEARYGKLELNEEAEQIRNALRNRILAARKDRHVMTNNLSVVVLPDPRATRIWVRAFPVGHFVESPHVCLFEPQFDDVLAAIADEVEVDLIFMVSHDAKHMERVGQMVRDLSKRHTTVKFNMVVTPPLRVHGAGPLQHALGDVVSMNRAKIVDASLGFIPIMEDVYSLEIPAALLDEHIEGKHSHSTAFPTFVVALQNYVRDSQRGAVGCVRLKGDFVANLFSQIPEWQAASDGQDGGAAIVVGMDRGFDLMSVLMPHDSFASMVIEGFGDDWQVAPARLLDGTAEGLVEELDPQQCLAELKKISLWDECWVKLQDVTFGPELYEAANVLEYERNFRHAQELGRKAERTREMEDIRAASDAFKNFKHATPYAKTWALLYRQLGQAATLKRSKPLGPAKFQLHSKHQMIAWIRDVVCDQRYYVHNPSEAIEFLYECIEVKMRLRMVLRLILLYELTSESGIASTHVEQLKKRIQRTYGRKYMYQLVVMLEILRSGSRPRCFASVAQKFHLFPHRGRHKFVPLCVRLLQLAIECISFEGRVVNRWLTPQVHKNLQSSAELLPGRIITRGDTRALRPGAPVILLLPGGCTFNEINQAKEAAARMGRKLTILTSRLFGGDVFIDSYEL